ncbi:bifunctional [glutamine synthetase] adenylyltransferase/[glutamine synthetase]-adenylyl-L-tyrosine phosphorylase [Parvularcula sp. LCG005]|uniref:bifunctional [glutamine synthetase] adenylyltransferase/[glutamine synthetase]-adenylyl-L-tyrosine phosphorylase n=1 Tax=Parvularcula sp. LCG005 TaxID=3078805 RepID=UPI0029421899|nr:bifunctional [glutamine synthetase] adenylyltransferase/[glutamine synthetase]-adenylyl-L-tyrosine phosphorylase [Parvularcula sp. LCG005]WOI54007.1 bifunctional [glutamine synthetase] adenylyltransferase/[glutamine synthetase]-adenylyl-L-tyrosine phosphorylase [Parvularcula sp. LCG005]
MIPTLQAKLEAALEQGAASSILAAGAADDAAPEHALDRFLKGVEALSPFLGRLCHHTEDRLARVLAAPAERGLASLMPEVMDGEDGASAKSRLRHAKADFALALGLADLAGVFDLEDVIQTLSDFADVCTQIALNAAWVDVLALRGLQFTKDAPSKPDGIAIIAMGKHGGRELNYSSDIDLVAVYDPDDIPVAEDSRLDVKAVAVKAVQFMVDILSQQTAEGYVFRTDLRLRPNPGATSVAVSLTAAEHYYEVYGQNWERAAYIKARFCAGDEQVGRRFLEDMQPFIWRRNLDYGAVADIHAIKQQIHAEKGNPSLKVAGANIKLGQGGIREIEFFAQTQQLLLGGRDLKLRSSRTVEALRALHDTGQIEADLLEQLTAAYVFHRNLEHRLQMREDTQTQDIPEDPEQLAILARMMGFEHMDEFCAQTLAHMNLVHDSYADLFGAPAPAEPVPGSLVFTGVEDDPRTLETLRKLNFSAPELVTSRIRRWHQGGLRATRSVRARELLTDLVPRILTRLGQLDDPDAAFAALDGFFSSLSGGLQVFALFTAQPEILDDVLVLCQSSPELARKMGQRPALVEGLLEGFDIHAEPLPPAMDGDILEDRLDEARRLVNEHRTRSSAGLVLGRTDPFAVGQALSDMADVAIADLMAAVRADMTPPGQAPAGEVVVLGFGRLGAQALSPHSDLDLVFVYRSANEDETEVFFTRLIRRIVSALSVPTAEGELYEIDMKLRPSGGAGPTAVSLSAFDHYYQEKAWVWEVMALTKARVVAGDSALVDDVRAVMERTLTTERPASDVLPAVLEMRRRLLSEKPAETPFHVKRRKGGLTDIDFIVQSLALIHGQTLGRIPQGNEAAIAIIAEHGLMKIEDAKMLIEARRAMESLAQYGRAVFGAKAPPGFSARQEARLRGLWDGWTEEPIADQLELHAARVADVFERLVGPYEEDPSSA